MTTAFKALLVSRDEDKKQSVEITELNNDDLMPGDVTIAVSHSTVNYKDGLALTGKAPVIRHWPMIPGIDFAGRVESSDHTDFKAGDEVILNGWGVGETHWGGYAERARVNGNWLIPLPTGLSPAQAMAIGTAGYTAMLCVMALQEQGVTADAGDILVTGAAGGVGSTAIILLAAAGYRVVASTGRIDEADYLKSLGTADIIDRNEFSEPGRPLAKERWAGAVDCVGSHTLANILSQTCYGGAVAACGLAQGMDLPSSVAPFILRGIKLIGVDSVMAPKARRQQAWQRLAQELDQDKLAAMTTTKGFTDIVDLGHDILKGQIRGRVVIDINN